MALFTDAPINDSIDIQNYENDILNVCHTEDIDLTVKMSLAKDEIADELTLFLLRRLQPGDFLWTQRRTIGLSDVVVTPPLRRWHAYKTLALIYRDAYSSQLNDRYQGKRDQYEDSTRTSARNLLQIGLGLVMSPVPRAVAPALSKAPGEGSAATYYVAIAWLNQAGEEGGASDMSQITTSSGELMTVETVNAPPLATGWNVYVGTMPTKATRQNSTPIASGTPWTMTGELVPGPGPGDGQQATTFIVDSRVIERG